MRKEGSSLCIPLSISHVSSLCRYGRSKAAWVAFVIGCCGLPFFVLLAVFPMADYGKVVGVLHLSSAGIALICFGLYMEITSILCLVKSARGDGNHPEASLSGIPRTFLYVATFLCALLGSLLFATWIAKLSLTHSSTAPHLNQYEWAGLSLMFSSLWTFIPMFALHREGHYRPLN